MSVPESVPPQPGPDPSSEESQESPAFRLYRTAAEGRYPAVTSETYDRLVRRALMGRTTLGLGHECQVWVPFALSAAVDRAWRDRGYDVELVDFDDATEMALLYVVRAGTCASPPNP